jgi:pSer/pThr/pTyr-binding forkhead associated (FHA) protein
MPSPKFPATATLLDARQCPLDKFDALFAKITQERRIADGYFLHDHPDAALVLFVVNGSPYGAGRAVGQACTFLEIHEFFAAYAENPQTPLSFFVTDKRLLLGLMVLFRHQPALTFRTDLTDMSDILRAVAERNIDQVLGLRSAEDRAVSICAKGRPIVNFFPPGAGDAAKDASLETQLAAYVQGRDGGVSVDVFEETRVGRAGDAILATPETRGRLVEVFLEVAARVKEEEAAEAARLIDVPSEERLLVEPEILTAPLPAGEPPVPSPEPEVPPLTLEPPAEPEPAFILESPAEPEPPLALELPVEATPAFVLEPQAEPEPPLILESPAEAEPPLALESPVEAAPPVIEALPPLPDSTSEAGPATVRPVAEVLLLLGDKQLGAFSLGGGELTIGRTPGNDIVIDNVGVSRRHAVMRVQDGKAFLEDLGSANGTFVRGQKIERHELQDGDEIAIVKHRLVYRIPKDSETPSRVEPMPDPGQRTMYIDTTTIAQAVGSRQASRSEGAAATTLRPRLLLPDLKKFALDEDEVTLGSGSGCQIQLSGMFVGRVHAKIVRTKEGQLKIQHLSGLAGTRVNGEKISEHILKHGDEIEIAKQKLLFRLER